MAMKRCPTCGEEYSETYKTCPFCEEAEAMDAGRPVHRRGGRRAAPQKGPNILTPVLIVVILVLAMLLVYLFFGSAIKEKLGFGAGSSQPPQSSQSSSAGSSAGAASSIDPGIIQEPDLSAPEPAGSGTSGGGGADVDLEAIAKLPKTLTVNNADFTLPVGDTYTVKVTSGGSGSYTWISSDDGVASVDANGKVTAIANGKVEITVTDGSARGGCVVYVKGGTAPPASSGGTSAPIPDDGKTPKLNRDDFTLPVGQTWQLTISGVTTAVTWSSKDPGVATVSANGTVTAVAKGMTTVTASYDNVKLTCIVRVP